MARERLESGWRVASLSKSPSPICSGYRTLLPWHAWGLANHHPSPGTSPPGTSPPRHFTYLTLPQAWPYLALALALAFGRGQAKVIGTTSMQSWLLMYSYHAATFADPSLLSCTPASLSFPFAPFWPYPLWPPTARPRRRPSMVCCVSCRYFVSETALDGQYD